MSAPKLYTSEELKARKSAYEKKRRAENREKILRIEAESRKKGRDKAVEWRQANKEGQAEYFKNRYLELKASGKFSSHEFKAKASAYYLKNKERISGIAAIYRSSNKGKALARSHNRRARILSVGGKISSGLADKLMKLQHGKCACCGKNLNGKFHLDHIVPIYLGGENKDSNMQLLLPTCNLQKNAKHPVTFMQSKGFLL